MPQRETGTLWVMTAAINATDSTLLCADVCADVTAGPTAGSVRRSRNERR